MPNNFLIKFFFNIFFYGKKYIILSILKGISPLKMHKIIIFSENLKKILGFTSKFRQGQVTLFFYLALSLNSLRTLTNFIVYQSSLQTLLTEIRSDKRSGLIWIQSL